MAKTCYVHKKFKADALDLIDKANIIIGEYQAQGYDLTLRQLYYQFVSRDFIANKDTEYKRLGGIVNDARLAGHIDWNAIVDRTRNLHEQNHWSSPADIVEACYRSYRRMKWADQPYRVEVWIEKEALSGVFERICDELDVPFFACRGYTSQSEMHVAAMRLRGFACRSQQTPVILHFGDHDPSGVDMTRDITNRLKLFMGGMEVRRLALNMDQVEEFNPPPNPAKITDSRAEVYIREYGNESWELDALDPATLAGLVREAVAELRDEGKWGAAVAREERERGLLQKVSENWDEIAQNL